MAKQGCFWHADKKTCLDIVLSDYEENDRYPQMLRHFYYILLSSEAIRLYPQTGKANPADQAYKWVSTLLVEARENGELPWQAIVDSGRRSFPHYRGDGLESFVQECQSAYYTLDPWLLQERRIEVWVEKDDMADVVNRMVEDLRIPVYVAKGYASATVKNDARERYGDGSGYVLLYLGDFDPTGIDIERELKENLAEFDVHPHIERVTLTYEHSLLLPASTALDLKESDPRTPRFKALYPDSKGYEMNIVGAKVIEERLLDTISGYMDRAAFDAAIEIEDSISREATKRLVNVMDGFTAWIKKEGAPGSTVSHFQQLLYFYNISPDAIK